MLLHCNCRKLGSNIRLPKVSPSTKKNPWFVLMRRYQPFSRFSIRRWMTSSCKSLGARRSKNNKREKMVASKAPLMLNSCGSVGCFCESSSLESGGLVSKAGGSRPGNCAGLCSVDGPFFGPVLYDHGVSEEKLRFRVLLVQKLMLVALRTQTN